MFTVTQDSRQQQLHTCQWSQKRAASKRDIHVNGHRRKHITTETYMLMVTEESTQQQKHTC